MPAKPKDGYPKRRPCLKCGLTFSSTGAGNRICSRCKARNGSVSRLQASPGARLGEARGEGLEAVEPISDMD